MDGAEEAQSSRGNNRGPRYQARIATSTDDSLISLMSASFTATVSGRG